MMKKKVLRHSDYNILGIQTMQKHSSLLYCSIDDEDKSFMTQQLQYSMTPNHAETL